MPKTECAGLQDFIGQLGTIIGRGWPQGDTVGAVKDVVTAALETKGWLPERCLRPSPDGYARHLLFKDPRDRFAIVVMVWCSGQKTPIHDHGGIWCVEGVYEGRIRVTRYDQDGPVAGGVTRFHASGVIEAGTGETGALIPPVEHHSIENPYERTAVTVHTYGCDMKSCQIFLPRPDGTYEVHTKDLCYTSRPEPLPGAALGS